MTDTTERESLTASPTSPENGWPENFSWADEKTWPEVVKQTFEYAGMLAVLSLRDTEKRMLDVQMTYDGEPVTMLFAIGERADELRQAWRSIYALHNKGVAPREPV